MDWKVQIFQVTVTSGGRKLKEELEKMWRGGDHRGSTVCHFWGAITPQSGRERFQQLRSLLRSLSVYMHKLCMYAYG